MKKTHLRKNNMKNIDYVNLTLLDNPTAHFAYFLGYIWADGSLNNYNEVRMGLVTKDIDDIRPVLESCGNFRINPRISGGVQPASVIHIVNRNFADFLKKYDYLERFKSADKILEFLPKDLRRYWFRGYWDGDGCFFIDKSRPAEAYQSTATGPYEQDWAFLKNQLNDLGVVFREKKIISKVGHKCSKIQWTGLLNFWKFCDFIYDAEYDFGLKRKFDKYKFFLDKRVINGVVIHGKSKAIMSI